MPWKMPKNWRNWLNWNNRKNFANWLNWPKLVLPIIWLGVILFWRFFSKDKEGLVWFLLGVVGGVFLPELERLFFNPPFLLNPRKPPFRNFLFQGFLAVLSFYVISSTTSWLGKGLVMAMFLRILLESFSSQDFFWPLQGELNFTQKKIIFWTMTFIFLFLSLLLI